MTLRELAESYDGSITMNVFASAEDENPTVTFPSDNYDAIKDEILDKEVDKYSVKVFILHAEVIVILVSDAPVEDTGTTEETTGEPTEETPEDTGEVTE